MERPLKRARCESPKTPVDHRSRSEPATCPAQQPKSRSNSMSSCSSFHLAADSPAKLVFFEEDDADVVLNYNDPQPHHDLMRGAHRSSGSGMGPSHASSAPSSCAIAEQQMEEESVQPLLSRCLPNEVQHEQKKAQWAQSTGAFFNALDQRSLNVVD